MKKNNLHPTRRQLLAMTGMCSMIPKIRNPVSVLLSSLVDGIIQTAHAEANPKSIPARNFVHISASGAPPRWYFDLPMNPYQTDDKVISSLHPMIKTRFSQTGVPEYATTPITFNGVTLRMPWLWSSSIPTPNGGAAPMGNLVENMLIMRGINMNVDGHFANMRKHIRPNTGAPSLSGLVADKSEKAIPAIGLTSNAAWDIYNSKKGTGQVVVKNVDASTLNTILNSFNPAPNELSATYINRRTAIDSLVQNALQSLGEYSRSANPGAENLFVMRSKAEALIRKGVGNIAQDYSSLEIKYANLISRCADYTALPTIGLTDKLIGASSDPKLRQVNQNHFTNNTDMRTLLQNNSTIPNLSASFAVAEYLLVNNYSSSIVFDVGYYAENILFQNLKDEKGVPIPNPYFTASFDEHYTGIYPSLIINSFVYRAISSCLYEFIRVLKSRGLFDETVIQLASEFGRVPELAMSGSQHGWQGNSTSVFSGAIKTPIVLGNIYQNSLSLETSTQRFMWGEGAPARTGNTEAILNIGNTTSTLARLLRVEPPMSNNISLVTDSEQSGITPTIDLAQSKTRAG